MRYFYCTVILRETAEHHEYKYLVKAKNIDEARKLVEANFDFARVIFVSVHINVITLDSMCTDSAPVRRIYLEK